MYYSIEAKQPLKMSYDKYLAKEPS